MEKRRTTTAKELQKNSKYGNRCLGAEDSPGIANEEFKEFLFQNSH